MNTKILFMFRRIKNEIRIIGWDDGPFDFKKKGKVLLVGVVYRGASFLDGLLKTEVEIDGTDATEKISSAVSKSKFKDLRVIMLDGITFAGFNTVDIKELYEKTKLPVIVVLRKKPDFEKFKAALKIMNDVEQRLKAVEHAGDIFWVRFDGKRTCFQCCGLKKQEAEEIIRLTTKHGLVPEPLRAAHLIATGIIFGESKGRA